MRPADQTHETFLFEALAELEAAQQEAKGGTEIVAMPRPSMTVREYLSRVLCGRYYSASEKLRETAQQYWTMDRSPEERNAAGVILLRAFLRNDGATPTKEVYTRVSIPDDEFQGELNYTALESASAALTHEKFQRENHHTLREHLVDLGLRQVYQLNALKLEGDPQTPEDGSYDSIALGFQGERRSIEEMWGERDQARLRTYTHTSFPAAEGIADMLLRTYPFFRARSIIDQVVDQTDISYTICCAFVPEMVNSEELQRGIIEVMKCPDVPPRMKFITGLAYVCHDNLLDLGNRVMQHDWSGP